MSSLYRIALPIKWVDSYGNCNSAAKGWDNTLFTEQGRDTCQTCAQFTSIHSSGLCIPYVDETGVDTLSEEERDATAEYLINVEKINTFAKEYRTAKDNFLTSLTEWGMRILTEMETVPTCPAGTVPQCRKAVINYEHEDYADIVPMTPQAK